LAETHRIGSDRLSATIAAAGAELVSLKDAAGEELLWQAGPEWPRHAPVLFPIVGKLAGDALRQDGATYRVTQHGFARDRRFDWIEWTETSAALTLSDDAETRALYPFAFRLEVIYAVEGAALSVTSRVSNPGDALLPFSVGAHPGFRWPLVDGVEKEAHVLEFGAEERGPRRTVEGGLLGPEAPLPFDGRTLPLNEELFARDALVLPDAASRSVRYAALGPDGETLRALDISWRGYRDLGIWSAPRGAPFLCVEPWRGMASFVGWDGPFVEKPGLVLLAPGETEEFEWRVAL
jgi:galactose mutarotase-like enzyme